VQFLHYRKKTDPKMKFIIPALCLSLLVIAEGQAQKVYKVDYASQADLKVFIVDYESQCDLKVYYVEYASQADRDGLWYAVEYESQADKKIYFTEYESQADLKIYLVEYSSQAGWRNKKKMHLLRH
jgi:hypothetical protein